MIAEWNGGGWTYPFEDRGMFSLRFDADSVKVGRHNWACRDRQVCVGNIFWDAVSMHADTASLLVADLIASGWTVEEHAEDGPFAKLVGEAGP